ncbi:MULTISPECIES: hypothetical protein [Chryseobacterium]|uniref:Uncharacterized protein n=1 Tax=Chryseobacterium candidae TaxID=1978493 RepID=A0ABY2R688_9FLAO|nr:MULTISPECIES: hypothetical protein [Chryseobacterium]PXW13600.1 hypothetical protein C8D70_1083 [Chryseobacterium sp. CBTAP 102]THV58934.1 hypothetical protein EK417_11220 [Chryseobacterium candidae]
MKKINYFITILLSVTVYSQVGINTSNPQTVFHIDGKKDNHPTNVPSTTQQKNDVVVTSSGNMGIGTISPSAKIHIISDQTYGAFQMQDGSQGTGRLLSSDENGKGTWINNPLTPIKFSTYIGDAQTPYDVPSDTYLNTYIDLPKGRWIIYIGQLFLSNQTSAANNTWIRMTLSSSSTSNVESGFNFLSSKLVSGWLTVNSAANNRYTFLSGTIPVEINGSSVTRLYLRTKDYTSIGTNPIPSTRGNYGENYCYAVPAY